jgi:hypothetical protein
MDPATTATGNITFTLYDVTDVTGTITAGGAPVTVTITTPGQNASLTFPGTTGQRVSLKVSNVTVWSTALKILNPNGSTLWTGSTLLSGTFVNPLTLGSTGTYTITIDPDSSYTGNLTFTLYNVPADPTATLTINGGGATLTTTTPGQNALATFAGTSGQLLTVRLTNNSMGSTTVKLLKPDGSQLATSTSSSANFNLAQQTLPTTGTYSVTIDPSGANIGSITVAVTNP